MKLGTIKQIQYPTGGTTTFDFEANTYWDTEGVKKLQDEPNLIIRPGGDCSLAGSNVIYAVTKSFNTFDLDNMFRNYRLYGTAHV